MLDAKKTPVNAKNLFPIKQIYYGSQKFIR